MYMSGSVKAGAIPVTFDGVLDAPYTLTASLVASDPFDISFDKRGTVYARYTAGANGRSLNYTIQINPYDEKNDPDDEYWSTYGIYTNSTGTWTEQPGNFNSAAAANTNPFNVTPLQLDQIDAARMRILAKESATGGGTVQFVFAPNTIN